MRLDRRSFLLAAAIASAPACSTAGNQANRLIDKSRCIGCGSCVPLCPMGAITLNGKSSIDPAECAECGTCSRALVCPVDAIRPAKLSWPRVIREVFSNPLAEHEATGVPGRGTEGIKTNDSRERYPRDVIGVYVELGRPALGARFRDADKVTRAFAARGIAVEADNPIAAIITDPGTGAIREDVLDEKVISILIEFIVPRERSAEIIELARELGEQVQTVFNLSIALRADPDGTSPLTRLWGVEIFSLPNGKVNIGLAAGIGKKEGA